MRPNAGIKLKSTPVHRPHRSANGFTLIELLVVIALTSILLTVVFKPLVASLDLTHRAATQTESQAGARDADAAVNSVLSDADYVLDPTTTSLNLWLNDRLGNPYYVSSQFTMIEYIPSAHQLDQNPTIAGFNLPIDPTTGKPSYQFPGVTPAQSGRAFPLTNGILIGRMFLALNNNNSGPGVPGTDGIGAAPNGMPTNRYFNFYEWANTTAANRNPSFGMSLNSHNPMTLYNAQVPTYIPNPGVPGSYIPNLMLFHTGPDKTAATDMADGPLLVHDPNFFYDNSLAGGNMPGAGTTQWAVPGWKDLNGDGKVEVWENWRAVSASLIRLDKVDLLSLQRDPGTNGIIYSTSSFDNANNNYAIISPLATFKPAFVQNDPAVPGNLDQSGNEVPYPIPPIFTSQYDHWASTFRVFVYRDLGTGKDPTQNTPLDYYEMVIDPVTGLSKIVHVTQAMNVMPGMAGPDPLTMPDVGPELSNNAFTNPNGHFAFSSNIDKGTINFGYPSTSVINTGPGGPNAYAPLPQRYSPDDINNAWQTAGLGPLGPGARRFLMLTTLPTTSWNASQLNPATITASPLAPASGLATPSIVPGTELVYGPDQIPGIHYGHRIQYSRVSAAAGFTGPNQYKINYAFNTNAPNLGGPVQPQLAAGYIEFNSQPDSGVSYNAGTTAVNGGRDINGNFATGTNMLPIWKFNASSGSVDGSLQSDPVEVYYNFQMNQATDVIKVDYLTRSLMIFTLEMRLYDPGSGKPQITRLTDKVKVRNLQH